MNDPQKNRRIPKLIIDPGQTSFEFATQEGPKATDAKLAGPVAPKSPSEKKSRIKAAITEVKRGPVRARISFEAPGRLKRKLERAARDRDRSKTALLRAALESYLRRPHAEDEDE